MPVSPTLDPPAPKRPRRPRRTKPIPLAVAAVVAVVIAMSVLGSSSPTKLSTEEGTDEVAAGRNGSGTTADGGPLAPAPSGRVDARDPRPADSDSHSDGARPPARIAGTDSGDGSSGTVTAGPALPPTPGSAEDATGPPATQVVDTDRPGSEPPAAPVPERPTDAAPPEDPTDHGPGPAEEEPDPAPAEPNLPITPMTLAPDEELCPNLGLVAVGDSSDERLHRLRPRFRAEVPSLFESADGFVCASPMTLWRGDLAVQAVRVDGRLHGQLVSGLGDDDPVMLLTDTEWASWLWRSDHNFVGTPLRREVLDGVPIIRTSRGAVVMEHPDSMGIPVVNAAWDLWQYAKGPAGPMGMPVGRAQGVVNLAWQDFEHGRLIAPGIVVDLQAEVAPAATFDWRLWPADDPDPRQPFTANSVIEIAGAAYYLGEDGKRHWIQTTGDWYCARDRMNATMRGNVEGRLMKRFELGERFVCRP